MSDARERIYETTATYYSRKLKEHGATSGGVDWKDRGSHWARFDQIAKVIDGRAASVADLGCGYGAFLTYLRETGYAGSFLGVDVSADMVLEAQKAHAADSAATFVVGAALPQDCDVVVSSGIFNVKQDNDDRAWLDYIECTIEACNARARHGFSFNMLTSYSDKEKQRPDLYYGDPLHFFDLCKRRYSRNVALLHDYGLYEFTIIVRKTL
jgi:SAM-dependent methyltransferase